MQPKNVVVLISDYRKYLSMILLLKVGRDSTCMRCEQVDDLLSTVAELKEEIKEHQSRSKR